MNKTAKLYSSIALMILSGIYLAALFFGAFPINTVAALVLIFSFLLLYFHSRNWTNLIFSATVCALLYAITRTITVSSAWICIFACITLGAYIITVGDKMQIFMVVSTAPISYLASLALTQDPMISLAALIPFPAMICMGACTRKCVNRKPSTIYSTLCLFASTALGIFVLSVKHSVSISGMRSSVKWIQDFVVDYMSNFTITNMGEEMNIFREAEYIREYIESITNILPGTLIFFFVIIAFALQSCVFDMLKKERFIEYMTSDVTSIQISGFCAALYLVALVLSLTTNSEGKIMLGSAIMQNIYLALTPALAYVAIGSINKFFQKLKIRPGILITIPAALLLYYGLLSVGLALLGATVLIASKAKSYADDRGGKENNR